MANKIILRRDTAANWTNADPVLSNGEIGLETDTEKFKIGNGVQSWSERGYYANAATIGAQYATLLTEKVTAAQAQVALAAAQVTLATSEKTAAAASALSASGSANAASDWRDEAADFATEAEGWADAAEATAAGVVNANDALVEGLVNDSGSDTRAALDGLFQPLTSVGGGETASILMWPELTAPRASDNYYKLNQGNTIYRTGVGTDTWDHNWISGGAPTWLEGVNSTQGLDATGAFRLEPGSYIITGTMRIEFAHNASTFTPGDLYGFGFTVSTTSSSSAFLDYWNGDLLMMPVPDMSTMSAGVIQPVLSTTRHVSTEDYVSVFGNFFAPANDEVTYVDDVTFRFDITRVA